MKDTSTTIYIAKKPDQNGFIHYSDAENAVWQTLYQRQIKLIENRACDAYMDGLKRLELSENHIPQCKEISETLQALTGWSVAPVEALISFEEFFQLLNNKQFPAASFIRTAEELDYLKEPDIFHELFGHCAMLSHPAFAEFTHKVGQLGIKADQRERAILARLYWFTVEFGLVKTAQGLRIYGGGILSSKTETVYALESEIPVRLNFDLLTVLRTPYRYDELQKIYFVIESIDALFSLLDQDLLTIFHDAQRMGMLSFSEGEFPDELRSC